MAFDINTDEFIKLTVKLGNLHRAALPVAVRATLNDAAFETKALVPITASREFTIRNKSFFRAFSAVNKARGFDINSMQSEVGINASMGKDTAEGLAQQEKGGIVSGRKLVPFDAARIGGSNQRQVRKKHKLAQIKFTQPGRQRVGGINYLLIKKGSTGFLFEIMKTKLKPLYFWRDDRKSKVEKSPFMAPASMIARNKIPGFYKRNAERQFNRVLR